MKVKRIHHTLLIILIVIVVMLALYFYVPRGSQLSIFNSGYQIDTDISKTTINQIAETDEIITYRFRWFSTNDFTYHAKNLNLEFYVGDYQNLKDKPKLPDDVPNQFDVSGEVILTGLQDNLITKKSVTCHLIEEEGKPRMSCKVNVQLKSDVPIDYSGNVDGYADIIFRKEAK